MIFVQAASNPNGPAMACFDRLTAKSGQLILSLPVLLEIAEVLNRPELHQRLKTLTPERVGRFLDEVKCTAVFLDHVPHTMDLPRDPKDEPYLDLAIAADADFLITWNERHLTYLMESDTTEGHEFRSRFSKLTITNPVKFLKQTGQ
jgi:putative PIN family toxin of toxin-antitoxin system